MTMEQKNPKLRSRRYMADRLSELLMQNLTKQRKPLRYSRKDYRELIRKLVLIHEKPLIAAVTVGFAVDNFDDPTEVLEEGIRFSLVTSGSTFGSLSREERKQRLLERARQSASVVRPTLLYIWRSWSGCFRLKRSQTKTRGFWL